MNEDKHTIKTGHLDVGGGHKIYYQQWGNPKAKPTFFFHGGPGSNCSDKHKLNYDPKIHHIVFHDQRGAGQSMPFGSISNNTTMDLLGDIEKLRKMFGFNKIQLTGSSWGSFISLAYAATHPDKVSKILVSAIFTGTQVETDHIVQGGLKTHYPEAWQQFIEKVPEKNKADTAEYYLKKMQTGTEEEQMDHVRRWVLLEASAMSIDGDYSKDLLGTKDYEETVKAMALLGAYYFDSNGSIEDKYIYKRAKALKDIPIVMVHGRFDSVCPPKYAYKLANAIGDNCRLHIVPSSHKSEGALREAFRAYAWSFLA